MSRRMNLTRSGEMSDGSRAVKSKSGPDLTMRITTSGIAVAIAFAATLALAACESSEDRAERHYASALELVEQGDTTRALLELRNVFRHNGTHLEARRLFADLNMAAGDAALAMRHYLLLSEQDPDNVEVRQILAEQAINQNDWTEAVRHGEVAIARAPQEPRSVALSLALDYRRAVMDRDNAAQTAVFERVQTEIGEQPDNLILRRISIDYLTSRPDPGRAMPDLEAALALRPNDVRLHYALVQLLNTIGDADAVTEQLERMIALFPENEELEPEIVRWHMSQNRPDRAKDFLRAQAAAHSDDPARLMSVVSLMLATEGRAAARAELNALISSTPESADIFRSSLAVLDFQDGETDAAIAEMTALIESSEPSDTQRDMRLQLAQMYIALGRTDEARVEIETILTQDPTNVTALVQRAAWLLQERELLQAQSDLRSAQSQDPRNPLIMTYLASAFALDGAMDLAGEQLALAVQASGNGAEETLRYVSFLRQENRTSAIETLLTDALRVAPQNIDLLSAMAEFYLRASRWGEARGLVDRLAAVPGEEGPRLAQQLRAAILLGQDQIDEGLSILQDQVRPDDGNISPVAVVVAAQVRAGRTQAARDYLEGLLAERPDSPELLLLSANLEALLGNADIAEARYRTVLAEQPDADNASVLLYGLLRGEGRDEDADEVLLTGLENTPDSIPLMLIRARELEVRGEFDAAITIYEQMQELTPDNIVAANNLASMLTTYRESEEDLERAAVLARPLRGSTIPAFQDTYGWIAFRQGNLVEAESHLVPAAESLPNEPLVQYHLARLLIAQDRTEEAIIQMERAIELMEGRPLPQMESARAQLDLLLNPAPAPAN